MGRNYNTLVGGFWMLVILCVGEPDLIDGLVQLLMSMAGK